MKANMKTNWNSGMDYGFSTIKTMLSVFGVWPLQRNELLCIIRWLILVITEISILVSILVENFQSCGNSKDFLEMVILVEGCVHGLISTVFPCMYMKKIAVNISSAIDDWSTLSTEKKSRAIMMVYARMGRTIVIGHLVMIIVDMIMYVVTYLLGEKQQVITVDNHTMIAWTYSYPATCLFGGVSYRTYNALIITQIFQITVIAFAEIISDTFFFSITMHLCGQLELLRNRFVEIRKNTNDKKHHENTLRPLIRRHHHLIMLARNIEDSFNINILMRFMIISVVIAMSGMRVIFLVRQHEYNEAVMMILYIQFYFVQCFLFTFAGDILYSKSEAISTAIYNVTWYELPPATVKDLILVMIRLKTPLRLSAGKFFYLTRSTMTDIMRATMTYISFLQVTMED